LEALSDDDRWAAFELTFRTLLSSSEAFW
jgi:hypothetical protein